MRKTLSSSQVGIDLLQLCFTAALRRDVQATSPHSQRASAPRPLSDDLETVGNLSHPANSGARHEHGSSNGTNCEEHECKYSWNRDS